MSSPAKSLNGRYRLLQRLGGDGMGTVWKAFDNDLERTVAVKELAPGAFDEDNSTRRERAKREAIALAQVEHPVIVTVHDLITVAQAPWIVMGYVPGETLSDIIKRHDQEPLPERRIAAIALAVLNGLQACHTSQPRVYHRDVKPGNIIIGPRGSVHLVDFGIARIVGKVSLTDAQKIIGTPQFLAPELFEGESAGPGTDLWALGVTLYYALTGHSPFEAENIAGIFYAIKFRNPPEPRDGGPLANLVLQMLSKRPEERPDAATVATVLTGVASQPDRSAGQVFWSESQPRAERPANSPLVPKPRPSELSGLPVRTQAQVVAGMPTDRAVAELLALSRHDAAKIINCCDDALGGSLLSAIAVPAQPSAGDWEVSAEPTTARKILQMLPPGKRGELIDHMSSIALATVLALPFAEDITRIVDRADIATLVGAISEMPAARAALLVLAMEGGRTPDRGRATELLRQAGPARAADILRCVPSVSQRHQLLSRLPDSFQASVRKYSGE